jgi:hypothetical protein
MSSTNDGGDSPTGGRKSPVDPKINPVGYAKQFLDVFDKAEKQGSFADYIRDNKTTIDAFLQWYDSQPDTIKQNQQLKGRQDKLGADVDFFKAAKLESSAAGVPLAKLGKTLGSDATGKVSPTSQASTRRIERPGSKL